MSTTATAHDVDRGTTRSRVAKSGAYDFAYRVTTFTESSLLGRQSDGDTIEVTAYGRPENTHHSVTIDRRKSASIATFTAVREADYGATHGVDVEVGNATIRTTKSEARALLRELQAAADRGVLS